MHRSEDYPGAFDILCGCGYLILNPDIGGMGSSSNDDYNEINFEGPPAVAETAAKDLIKVHQEIEEPQMAHPTAAAPFSAENLTPSDQLPEGMLYDPGEVPLDSPLMLSEIEETNKVESTISRIFVERVQRASIGQILGPDYELEFSNLDTEARLKARERVEKFLQDHKWLREEMERRSFVLAEVFQTERMSHIPEALAVEMYIACLENGGKCLFIRQAERLTA